MARTVIVSEDTLRSLVEQNASMAAWYHAFVRSSREQTPVVSPPPETIARFLARIADEFPELASVVRSKAECAPFSPLPLDFGPVATQRANEASTSAGAGPDQTDAGKPALVNPRHVKY